jgi:predicted transposase YdaD
MIVVPLWLLTNDVFTLIIFKVIAQGNIIIGEELEMISRRKSFAIALSREMVPTARLVVYYISGQPEEIVMDSISFYVSGLRANPVSMNNMWYFATIEDM